MGQKISVYLAGKNQKMGDKMKNTLFMALAILFFLSSVFFLANFKSEANQEE